MSAQRDPDLTVTIVPPSSRVVEIGGRRMCFEGGRILEVTSAPDEEISRLRADHARLVELQAEYADLVADVIAMLGAIGWPKDAAARVAIEGVRARIGIGPLAEPESYSSSGAGR